jgi:hypothetical protein
LTLEPTGRAELDLAAILDALDRHSVRWVLTGSLVLAAYGARLTPNDIDVTPALDDDNLAAVARLAAELEAVPAHAPDWPDCPPLEWHHHWRPWPATTANLDHLFVTTAGMVDIVPELCGTYDELVSRATPLQIGPHQVLVADPGSVLDRISQLARPKDLSRAEEIARLRDEIEQGVQHMSGLEHLLRSGRRQGPSPTKRRISAR